MNEISHFDLHPDAELLNAFAEHELAVAERDEVLAHLAGCARCREVVFLAHDATVAHVPEFAEPVEEFALAAPMAAAAAPARAEAVPDRDVVDKTRIPASASAKESAKEGWLVRWRSVPRIAWMGATAIAMTAVVAVVMIAHRRIAPPQQMATGAQPQSSVESLAAPSATAPAQTMSNAQLSAVPQAKAGKTPSPAVVTEAVKVAPGPPPLPQQLPVNGREFAALSPIAPAPAGRSASGSAGRGSYSHVTSQGNAMEQAQSASTAGAMRVTPEIAAHGAGQSQPQQMRNQAANADSVDGAAHEAAGQGIYSGVGGGSVGGGVEGRVAAKTPQQSADEVNKVNQLNQADQANHVDQANQANQTVAIGASSQTVTVDAATANAMELQAAPPTVSVPPADRKTSGLVMLPGGLPMVSTAEAGPTQVAVDAIGGVFVSHDFGKTWNRVKLQWKGHAAKVRLAQPAMSSDFAKGLGSMHGALSAERASGSTSDNVSRQASGQVSGQTSADANEKRSDRASAAQGVFELVNDKNAVWTSSDGKTWKPKRP